MTRVSTIPSWLLGRSRRSGWPARRSGRAAPRPGRGSTPAPGWSMLAAASAIRTAIDGQQDRVDERLEADPLQRADVAHLGDADDQRREDQRNDQHEQQAQEDLADRLGDISGSPTRPRARRAGWSGRARPAARPMRKPISIFICSGTRRFAFVSMQRIPSVSAARIGARAPGKSQPLACRVRLC